MDLPVNLVILSLVLSCTTIASITALQCFSCDDTALGNNGCKYLQTDQSPKIDCPSGITHCFSSSADGGLALKRGCLDAAAPASCDGSSAGDSCEKCTTDLCNSAQLAFDKCASCDLLGCNVTSSATSIVQCRESTADRGGCYRQNSEEGHVKRGCVSDLDAETFEVCSQADGEVCKICKGDECNLKDHFQRCFICDSENDPECIRLTYNDHEYSGVCKDYMDSCVAFVIPNGKTVRGCQKEVDPEPTYCPSTNCVVCSTSGCNYGIVPDSRISCFQCNSTSDPDCNGNQFDNHFNSPEPCASFQYDDQCYKYWDEATGVGYRGCLSDKDEVVSDCEKNPERCATCSFSACNFDPLLRNPQLWCVQCDRSAACMWSYKTPSKPCARQVPFYETESCYQYLYPSGLFAKRGCALDDKEFCEDKTCPTCTNHFCNGDSYLSQSCVRCRSDGSEMCEERAAEIEGEKCIIDPTYSQRGCYSFRDDSDVLHRGCYFDMEDDWRTNCDTKYESRCTRCYGDNCNTNLQGSGIVITASKVLIGCLLVGVTLITKG